jgi:hypothetical protein
MAFFGIFIGGLAVLGVFFALFGLFILNRK